VRPPSIPRCPAAALLAAVVTAVVAATTVEAAPAEVTLGGTGGTPSGNICVSGFSCTYVPFHLNQSSPELQVPADGTVTSFSVNAGSAGGKVRLRVLRPASGGRYTGAGTSPEETLATTGVNTFDVSLPVRAGDVLGLDNDSSAILFDTSDATYLTSYWRPALADGATSAAPFMQNGYRLLLSATVIVTPTISPPRPPKLTRLTQSHRVWREGSRLATVARAQRPPVGTTFSFRLDHAARVRLAFSQLLPGRRVGGRCVAVTSRNRRRGRCTRAVARGSLRFDVAAGAHRIAFQGRLSRTRRLPVGGYRVAVSAAATGLTSAVRTLGFTIVR